MTERGVVEEILDLYRSEGKRRYGGEAVTQEQHALQTAWLAEREGAAPALVAAALLHDIGHLIDRHGREDGEETEEDGRHEVIGAAFLARRFVPEVAAAVSLHVLAKRYLCARDPAYLAGLSPASRRSLAVQGGPFGEPEVRSFAAKRAADAALTLRRWDDLAKVPGLATPEIEHFRPALAAALRPGSPETP